MGKKRDGRLGRRGGRKMSKEEIRRKRRKKEEFGWQEEGRQKEK